ncbi:uncharacterized protein FOMMEDRAFT_159263 [Fomitiporia mediterranea MF3/22]|uniref:uncharacterized protein n=1 Tax=Fomitiporia mediterranea (strain MF3/22) TaxID=694068 RepID=UPI00044084C5|nr:uncharacterized protein FOMMEDRAFT_159263 [Fomitiporia mediterranea MF3/22]EJD00531.1 hypothetical protein FOMMEDRAFT_159263 [Fomitiporia mediterranea MF3/22]
MNVQIHSFVDSTSFLSLTGPTPALADCVLDERPSIPSDLKLGSMSHRVVGFSDFATSPCRPNAYEFPIISHSLCL